MTRKTGSALIMTHRAAHDVQDMYDYSWEQWGKQSAERYLDQLEASLARLTERPDLLKSDPDFHSSLLFYRVNQHLIVCDERPKSIVVLTVIHTSMDIPSRLAELQPTLSVEVELLHRKLESGRIKKSKSD